ncbi:hypothetical protein BASA81_002280 [Batrachochytrium salamandrivorans]|nr:hypothetical protein BASA81_002280 [Batrachochytrium salamandrivorans]
MLKRRGFARRGSARLRAVVFGLLMCPVAVLCVLVLVYRRPSPPPLLAPPQSANSSLKQRPLHFIYTVGCGGASDTDWQLLQSNVLDSSFRQVGQRGKLTRLVSGCVDDPIKQKAMSQSVLDNLDVVFLPGNDRPDNARVYVQANRPTTLQRYLNDLLLLDGSNYALNTVLVVLDPDFVFRKTLDDGLLFMVGPGRFLTQAYSLQDPNSYAMEACKEAALTAPHLPAHVCHELVGLRSYKEFHGGVPYMLEIKDWLKLLEWWIPLIGPVLKRYPGIESDMISWALAAKLAGLQGTRHIGFMATCMSSETLPVSVLEQQTWLHLCQSYYLPETRGGEFEVNPTSELEHIMSRAKPKPEEKFMYVFNKHWLKSSRLLEDCTVPLLVGPPSLPNGITGSRELWFQHVLQEAITAYNRAVVEFRAKYFSHCQPSASTKGLILHEIHRSRYGGGWSHSINL